MSNDADGARLWRHPRGRISMQVTWRVMYCMGPRLYALSVLCCNDHYCRLPYAPTLKLFPCLHLLRLKVLTRVRLPRANSAHYPLHHHGALTGLTSLPLVPHISIALTFHPFRIEPGHGNESIWKGRVSRVRMAWTTSGRDVAGAAHRWLSDTTRRVRTACAWTPCRQFGTTSSGALLAQSTTCES